MPTSVRPWVQFLERETGRDREREGQRDRMDRERDRVEMSKIPRAQGGGAS